ncbi:MAG TPA: thiamine pyrophosphate-dependent enzyme, partial [Pirellulales bacterium]|nr:thiamine pyrophosphate-dependent enzyme [Pirellulales bacterium]
MASETMIPIQSNGSSFSLPTVAFQGLPSTLCKGCGHNSITSHLIEACKSIGVDPYHTIKLSGIGCSSKTPAYFLQYSHGFNALHGRMPSVATGALLANQKLVCIGISGDGDTAKIGIGQFKHACRRNVPMLYIVEDNGCYGLTKGQFS